MRHIIFGVAIGVALTTSAFAQQPQITPSQMAIQIDNAVNGMASSIEILQAQLKQAQDRVKQLEAAQPKEAPKSPDKK